jgi:hypothetical protein
MHALLLLAALQGPAPAPPEGPLSPLPGLARVQVLGASVSDGFGLSGELEVDFDLGEFLPLALGDAVGSVTDRGSSLFFQDPEESGAKQVERALREEPTLVLAVDFLFWYAYGFRLGCEARMAGLEAGLAALDRLECPILVGDLPDMSAATGGSSPMNGGRALIVSAQVPAPECLARMNERVRAWAAERDRVHLFPLARFAREVRAEGVFELRGNRWDRERKAAMVQGDLLHTTLAGSAALVVSVLDELERAGLVDGERVLWNAEELAARAVEHTAPEREERRERRRRAEERRRAREEREQRGEEPHEPLRAAG